MAESAVFNTNNTEKKYAVVTGANKGIGYGIVQQLAAKGIVVVLTARDQKRGLEAIEKLKASGISSDNLLFHQLDVSDSSSVSSLAQFIESKFGKLDILVNNAGVSGVTINVDASQALQTAGPGGLPNFLQKTTNDYKSAYEGIQINYYGPKRMIEAFIPLLKKSKSPRIVNVASTLGQLSNIPDGKIKEILADVENLTEEKIDKVIDEFLKDVKEGILKSKGWTTYWPAYTISKAALIGYTIIQAKKYPDVKINAVCPGYVKTDINYNSGMLSVQDGAASPVKLALLPDDGPSGLFFFRDQVASYSGIM